MRVRTQRFCPAVIAALSAGLWLLPAGHAEEEAGAIEVTSVIAETAEERKAAPTELEKHFPGGLINAAGEKVDLASLEGKAVGIYFSAHWCAPCRAFTPKLVDYRNANKEKFEVVFVSSDRNPEAQISYMKESGMEWGAVRLEDDATKALKEKYKVRGIPTLVILKSTGEFLSRDGRSLVMNNTSADLLAHPKVTTETYNCGKCERDHTRLAIPEEAS